MKHEAKRLWVELTPDIIKKYDLIAKRMSRSRTKQMAIALTEWANNSYLGGERTAKDAK